MMKVPQTEKREEKAKMRERESSLIPDGESQSLKDETGFSEYILTQIFLFPLSLQDSKPFHSP